jgi:hypothetical protein
MRTRVGPLLGRGTVEDKVLEEKNWSQRIHAPMRYWISIYAMWFDCNISVVVGL